MKIINGEQIGQPEWDRFVSANAADFGLLQSWEWGEFQRKSQGPMTNDQSNTIIRLAVVDDDFSPLLDEGELPTGIAGTEGILAVAQIIKKSLPFGLCYFYLPRGPVINVIASDLPLSGTGERGNPEAQKNNDESGVDNIKDGIAAVVPPRLGVGTELPRNDILVFLFNEIKKIAKIEKAIFLRFESAWPVEDVVETGHAPSLRTGFSESRSVETRFIASPFAGSHHPDPLKRITPPRAGGDELINAGCADTPPSPRCSFGEAGQVGGEKLIPAGQIQPRQTLILDLAKSEEELLSAMKPKTRYNIKVAQKHCVKIDEGDGYFADFWRLLRQTADRDEFTTHDEDYYRKMLETLSPSGIMKLVAASYDGKVVAANLVVFFGDWCCYLHGASDYACRDKMAPQLLQWETILLAQSLGKKYYDFWGVDENKWPGVTRFKTGFAPETAFTSYAGAFDLPLNKFWYWIYKLLKR